LVAKLVDLLVTLIGQSAAYWRGDRTDVFEANPIARWLLEQNPALYIAASLGWAIVTVVLLWRLPLGLAKVLAFAVIFGHAIGVASWAIHGLGQLGWFASVPILLCASWLLSWSWKDAAT
jgi:hypothetical protein